MEVRAWQTPDTGVADSGRKGCSLKNREVLDTARAQTEIPSGHLCEDAGCWRKKRDWGVGWRPATLAL